ncbi:ribonuclease 1-like [Aristolochia californica]|uniref:ribonuclease 1-like n=1 Tax=Aristolochia californica TaxID=171875 RepID=UPI0035E206C4
MESCFLILIYTFLLTFCAALSFAKDFDFFYFVLQWPGSYCDTRRSCCYPRSGKPAADFGIHGLWPNYNDGSWPSNCDPDSPFDASAIKNLTSEMKRNWPTLACPSSDGFQFWEHEWEKHGTCSESVLSQYQYFQTALGLKQKANLLQILQDAGIEPDGGFYSEEAINDAIKGGIGYPPGIDCNVDEGGNRQLYQIYLCVDTSASDFIECPKLPRGRCGNRIEFPAF